MHPILRAPELRWKLGCWELAYPLVKGILSRWCSFPQVGYVSVENGPGAPGKRNRCKEDWRWSFLSLTASRQCMVKHRLSHIKFSHVILHNGQKSLLTQNFHLPSFVIHDLSFLLLSSSQVFVNITITMIIMFFFLLIIDICLSSSSRIICCLSSLPIFHDHVAPWKHPFITIDHQHQFSPSWSFNRGNINQQLFKPNKSTLILKYLRKSTPIPSMYGILTYIWLMFMVL